METFNFDDQIELENERVLIRPLRHEDLSNLETYALNEPEIWTYSLISPAGSREALAAYIEDAIAQREDHSAYPFIVMDKATGQYAGCTRFYDISPANGYLQLGYTWYGSQFCGTALNKNCKLLLLDFAFRNLKADRVEFRAHSLNERSIAAMKSIGCTQEGILRSHLPGPRGKRRDTVILSILRTEWESTIRQNLVNKINGSIS